MDEFTLDVSKETLGGFTDNPDIHPEPVRVDRVDQLPSDTTDYVQNNLEAPEEVEPKIIGKIKSSSYGGIVKIISLLTGNMGKSDIISIENGKLSTISGSGFLYCDLSILFGENNFDIIDPQYSIKLMKLITGGDEVIFIDDDANSRYTISNLIDDHPQITITLPKPDLIMSPKITKPQLGELQENLANIEPDLVNTIVSAEKSLDSQFFILRVTEVDGKFIIVSITTNEKSFKFNFKDELESSEGSESLENDIVQYKLFKPFPIPKPDEIEFKLYKSKDDELWVSTISEVGMAKIEYMEKLTPMGIFDTYSL